MKIVFVLFPNVTQLDFTGPLQVLGRLPGADVFLVAETLDPVPTDAVLTLNPTVNFEDCPQADILCIPGGFGVEQAIANTALMAFVRIQGANAKYVTSVCTGAYVLGVAGLLKGKRATTHWAYHDGLAKVGAIPVRERVVRDGNVITGGGVTAGIDFALTLAAEIAGNEVAQGLQLALEYDPAPPFSSGSPGTASPQIRERIEGFYQERVAKFDEELDAALNVQ